MTEKKTDEPMGVGTSYRRSKSEVISTIIFMAKRMTMCLSLHVSLSSLAHALPLPLPAWHEREITLPHEHEGREIEDTEITLPPEGPT